jgi:hypothetical protein
MDTYRYRYRYMYICISTHASIHMPTHTHTHTPTRTCTHAHTHFTHFTHTHTHTQCISAGTDQATQDVDIYEEMREGEDAIEAVEAFKAWDALTRGSKQSAAVGASVSSAMPPPCTHVTGPLHSPLCHIMFAYKQKHRTIGI